MRATSKETQRRILAAAAELFYSQGFRSVGIEAICSKAAVTKPTLYYYFGSKNALIAAYLEERNEAIFSILTRTAEGAEGSIADRVAALFEQVARAATNGAWKGCPFLRGAAEFVGDEDHPARHIASAHKKRFETWLTGFLARHKVTQSATLARQITVLLDGAVTHAFLHRDPAYPQACGAAARTLTQAALNK